MKAPSFDYCRVDTLAAAFEAWAGAEDEGVYLAGGHSLVPALNLRLQAPAILIDIGSIPDLHGFCETDDGWLRIGAMARHSTLMRDPLVARYAPLLAQAAPFVAHPAIRNRGTLGGNLCHADPASEFPAVMLALEAQLEIAAPEGTRMVAAQDFFCDLFETALQPGELLLAIHIPRPPQGSVSVFDELVRRRGDYAMTGVAVQAVLKPDRLERIAIAFCAMGATPIRASVAEQALMDLGPGADGIGAAQAALAQDLDPADDPQLPAAMRLHLSRVLLGRVLPRIVSGEGAA